MQVKPFYENEYVQDLDETRIYKHLGERDLLALLKPGEVFEYEAGELIIEEGTASQDMFVILKGSAVIEMANKESNVYVCTLGPGEIVGEAGLFIHVDRTASVRAREGLLAVKISRAAFFSFLSTNSQGGIKFLFLIIYGLLGRLRESNEELVFERRGAMTQKEIDRLIDELVPLDTQDLLETLGGKLGDL